MLSDELRELADRVVQHGDKWRLTPESLHPADAWASELRAFAAKLEGKVVVRPQTHQFTIFPGITYAYIVSAEADGATEAEAIANLQKLLDRKG